MARRKPTVYDMDDYVHFGKHKNKTVRMILHDDPTYIAWMSRKPKWAFTTPVIKAVRDSIIAKKHDDYNHLPESYLIDRIREEEFKDHIKHDMLRGEEIETQEYEEYQDRVAEYVIGDDDYDFPKTTTYHQDLDQFDDLPF